MTSSHDYSSTNEPKIEDLLDDPIAQLLMQIDGVERAALEPLLASMTEKVHRLAEDSEAA